MFVFYNTIMLLMLQQTIIFFAAGNNGGSGAQTLTTQATGKNTVAVASGESTLGGPNITYIAWYSSKGPTYDNRCSNTAYIRKFTCANLLKKIKLTLPLQTHYCIHWIY